MSKAPEIIIYAQVYGHSYTNNIYYTEIPAIIVKLNTKLVQNRQTEFIPLLWSAITYIFAINRNYYISLIRRFISTKLIDRLVYYIVRAKAPLSAYHRSQSYIIGHPKRFWQN